MNKYTLDRKKTAAMYREISGVQESDRILDMCERMINIAYICYQQGLEGNAFDPLLPVIAPVAGTEEVA